ncbi:L-fucose mutarotase [Streptomyces turgidiscabies]|nr:L-fucose mutarotase [Streptomyces turgidiscabies]
MLSVTAAGFCRLASPEHQCRRRRRARRETPIHPNPNLPNSPTRRKIRPEGENTVLLTELLHPGILEALAGAGHGARVLLADGHYPASTATGERARTVHLNLAPGLLDVTSVLDVLLTALPVESAHVMVPPEGEPEPPAIAEYRARLAPVPVGTLGRFEFYDAARSPDLALAIVTADIRTYANLLLTIGVRAEGTLSTR